MSFLLIYPSPICADNGYDTEFIDLLEIVYGEGYLSQGGSALVDRMFEGIELEGKTVLDLGCGIGGPALHLAKNHKTCVVGTDPDALMIQKSEAALERLQKHIHVKGSAHFVLMEDPLTLQQFPDNSFDIVTSRESILHVPNEHKQHYFKEIFRVLKTGGQLVLLDWQHHSPNYSEEVKNMMEMDGVPFYLMTPEEYHQTIVQSGFSHITRTDLTDAFFKQTQDDLSIISTEQDRIIEEFGKETLDYSLNSWRIQGQAFERKELLVAFIKAKKE